MVAENPLPVYTIYNNHHESMFLNYFLPSFDRINRGGLKLFAKKFDLPAAKISQKERFEAVAEYKIKFILKLIRENWGRPFVFSDADVQFFKDFHDDIIGRLRGVDGVFQDDIHEACSGFFCIMGNERTEMLFRETLASIHDNTGKTFDQSAMNEHISLITYRLLPRERYFTVGSVFNSGLLGLRYILSLRKETMVQHANYVITLKNKSDLLEDFKNYANGSPAIFFIAKYGVWFPARLFYINFLGKAGSYLKKHFKIAYVFLKPYFPDKN